MPVKATSVPRLDPAIAGERRSRRKTPALTIVLEWSRAEVGDGAYIAPSSHDENGICAAFVRPARQSSASAGRSAAVAGPAVSLARSRPSGWPVSIRIAIEKPSPPSMFMFRASKA